MTKRSKGQVTLQVVSYPLQLTHHPTNSGGHRTRGCGDITTTQHTKIIAQFEFSMDIHPVACKKSEASFNILEILQFKKSYNPIG